MNDIRLEIPDSRTRNRSGHGRMARRCHCLYSVCLNWSSPERRVILVPESRLQGRMHQRRLSSSVSAITHQCAIELNVGVDAMNGTGVDTVFLWHCDRKFRLSAYYSGWSDKYSTGPYRNPPGVGRQRCR
ncbi:hypothetical protein OIU92_21535 [Escherichia coli]|nr:hypothetical protein [Escherichia coli]